MTNGIGYSHAIFQDGNYTRKYALEADNLRNGGNENGILDGKEIEVFKNIIKTKTGYDFDFSKIGQVELKKEAIQDNNGNWIHTDERSIALKYKSATVKSTQALNNKEYNKSLFIPKNKELNIAYMANEDYDKSVLEVNRQEEEMRVIIDRQNEEAKLKAEQEYIDKNKSCLEKLAEWVFSWT